MVFNHSTIGSITAQDKELFTRVIKIIYRIFDSRDPREDLGRKKYLNFNCHSICRAIAICIPELSTVSGSYAGLKQKTEQGVLTMAPCWTQHSWLVTPDSAVIDPHPVGVITAAPLLAIGKGPDSPFGSGLYVPDWNMVKHVSNRELWRKSFLLSQHIKAIMG